MIASLEGSREDDEFAVWPENWEVLCAFLCVSTQWRALARPDGRVWFQGFDYAGVAAGLAGCGAAATPALWKDLRVMEGAGLNRLNGIDEMDL